MLAATHLALRVSASVRRPAYSQHSAEARRALASRPASFSLSLPIDSSQIATARSRRGRRSTTAKLLVGLGKVVEVGGNEVVVEAELLLLKGDRALEHGHRLGCAARSKQGLAKVLGDDPHRGMLSQEPLTLSDLSNNEEAVEVYERQIEARERSPRFGPSHETTWNVRDLLGTTLVKLSRFSEAIPLRDSLAAYDGMGHVPLQREQVLRVILEHLAA